MSDKTKKDNQSQGQSLHQYQNVVQELDQMLQQKQSNAQESKQSSKKYDNKPKPQDMVNNSATGIKEFDELLDGGFPKGAVVLLAGSSGSGKTIFAFQWLFEGIKNKENAVYITLTEPLFKIVKNLEKMDFYDRDAIEQEKLKIVDMRDSYAGKGFNPREILDFIEGQVKQTNAKRLCIDSITAVAYHYNDKSQIRTFIFELGKILATLGCTTILTSEVADPDKYSVYEVEEFIADAILRLDQIRVKDDFQRVMRIVKVRGKSYRAEAIPLKISADGIEIFPKIHSSLEYRSTGERVTTGNHVLDDMLMGGVIQGYTTLVAGSTGTGKTLLALQFIMDGLKKGEPCFYAGFEESKEQLTRNAKSFGWNLEEYEKKGLLTIRSVYPSDKLLEEHLKDIKQVVENNNIKRCVIDSLSSILHSFDEDVFSGFAIRLNGYLKAHDVTSYFTTTTGALIGSATLAENNLSTLTDSIIMLRYVEMQGKLESVINILKMRGSAHCKDLRRYEITNKGVVIGSPLSDYEGIMTGSSKKIHELEEEGEKLKKIIKEKEEMEGALRNSEERFKDISYSMADWVWEVDKGGRYTFSSGRVKEILGYEHEELIGKTLFDFMSEDEAKRVGDIFKEITSEKKPIVDLENWHLTKKGEKIYLLTNGVPMLNENGELIGYRGVDKDITERKKMEHALRIKESAVSSSINAIAFIDLEGKVTYVNPSFLEMWRYDSEKEVLGKTAVTLWQKKGQYMEIMDASFEKGGWVGELVAERSDGSLFDAQLSANIVKDEEDNPICMMVSFVDITKTKRLEEALRTT